MTNRSTETDNNADEPKPEEARPEAARTEARFAHKAVLASVIAVAVVALFLLLWYSVYVLFLLFAGVLVAILLRALAEVVARYTRLSHRWSLAIVLVVLALALGGFWWFAARSVLHQAAELSRELPEAWQDFQDK